MAKDAPNDITFFIALDEAHKDYLAAIRHWSNLKIAFDAPMVWVKDIDYAQLNSLEAKSIPFKTAFYTRDGKLFLLNSNLPDRNIPSLLWTPIDRAIPIKMPSFNHNYFGIEEKISIHLVPSDKESEAVAMITDLKILQQYIETAAGIRLQKISWAILNDNKAFLLGKPLLPIDGDVFWRRGDALIPAGHDFDLYSLTESANQLLNPEKDAWIIWNTDSTYFLIQKDEIRPLSLSSFRLSMQQLAI